MNFRNKAVSIYLALMIDLLEVNIHMTNKVVLALKRKKAKASPSNAKKRINTCLLYTSPSPRDGLLSRMPSSA